MASHWTGLGWGRTCFIGVSSQVDFVRVDECVSAVVEHGGGSEPDEAARARDGPRGAAAPVRAGGGAQGALQRRPRPQRRGARPREPTHRPPSAANRPPRAQPHLNQEKKESKPTRPRERAGKKEGKGRSEEERKRAPAVTGRGRSVSVGEPQSKESTRVMPSRSVAYVWSRGARGGPVHGGSGARHLRDGVLVEHLVRERVVVDFQVVKPVDGRQRAALEVPEGLVVRIPAAGGKGQRQPQQERGERVGGKGARGGRVRGQTFASERATEVGKRAQAAGRGGMTDSSLVCVLRTCASFRCRFGRTLRSGAS